MRVGNYYSFQRHYPWLRNRGRRMVYAFFVDGPATGAVAAQAGDIPPNRHGISIRIFHAELLGLVGSNCRAARMNNVAAGHNSGGALDHGPGGNCGLGGLKALAAQAHEERYSCRDTRLFAQRAARCQQISQTSAHRPFRVGYNLLAHNLRTCYVNRDAKSA